MSLELLPPTPKHLSKWHVRANRCRCHPETCCCDDWAVYDTNGENYLTFFDKESADDFAAIKNRWMAPVEYHKRCYDCGQMVIKALWVPTNHSWKKHALCGDCASGYDDIIG